MKLVIVESPSKAKTIQKYLGSEYQVIASAGHLRDLPVRTLGVDVKNNFQPTYVINDDKSKTVNEIKAKASKADEILLATDPDREGEAISWHIKEILGLKEDSLNRIEFNEITKNVVNAAVTKPRKIDLNLVNAQQTRRILDRLVGYKISPFLGSKVRKGLSAGRVQSVALKILVEREREIEAFKPEEYWNIHALVSRPNDNEIFKANFIGIDSKKYKITNEEDCLKIVDQINKGDLYVDNVKRATYQSKPNAPFTTSTMQQDAVSKLSFSAPKVSQLAQKLYEGIDIPGYGQTALVTYIRTDSTRVSKEAQYAAREKIKADFGNEYVPKSLPIYGAKKGAQDAHEAIRPVNVDMTPALLKDKIDRDLWKLYKLIYERFMASQMSNAEYDTLTVKIVSKSDREYDFQLKGKTLKFAGYTVAYKSVVEETNEDKEEEIPMLPSFLDSEPLSLKELQKEQKFTKPPLRYTEATLIKKLEESGIGRPSTYTTIMQVLSKRDYTEKVQKALKPTKLGDIVVTELDEFFENIMDLKFTSKMETNLDEIADGKRDWIEVLNGFYPTLEKNLLNAQKTAKRIYIEPEDTGIECSVCHKGTMLIREGRYGKFLGCSAYPECNHILNYGEIVSKCPKCGEPIIKRFSKKHKVYYSCADKKCDFISWDIPASHFCPNCGGIMKIGKHNGKKANICINQNCGLVQYIEEKETSEK